MGDEVEVQLVKVLSEYSTSPFGNPIPGLDELLEGIPNPERAEMEDKIRSLQEGSSQRASDIEPLKPIQVRILSINEIIQVEHKLMAKFHALDMRPGSVVKLVATEDGLEFSNDNGAIVIPEELGHAVRVEKVL